jgi:hypothetical protein
MYSEEKANSGKKIDKIWQIHVASGSLIVLFKKFRLKYPCGGRGPGANLFFLTCMSIASWVFFLTSIGILALTEI